MCVCYNKNYYGDMIGKENNHKRHAAYNTYKTLTVKEEIGRVKEGHVPIHEEQR